MTFFSSQTSSSVMMPLQTSMNQFGGGYYPARKGQGVDQNPSWPAISQNQSFPGPWSQMPQPTTATSPVTASHAGGTNSSHQSHTSHWSQPLQAMLETSPTSVHHVGDEPLASASHAESMSPAIVSDMLGEFIRLRSLDV
jgi:hypothetical protein